MIRFFAILFLLLCANFSYAESIDDIDLSPELLVGKKNSINRGMATEISIPKENKLNPNTSYDTKNKKNKTGFFGKRNKPVFDSEAGGYSGNLPNLKSEFKDKIKSQTKIENKGDNPDNYTPEEFQKSNIDDPLFLDVILNKEKESRYVLDMLKIMQFLENFRAKIEKNIDVQKFIANVNLLDLYAKRIEKLYSEKPEGMSPSYYKLLDLAYKAKVLGNLKYSANYYAKFSPLDGTEYAPSRIKEKDDDFLVELDKTIFLIRQLNN